MAQITALVYSVAYRQSDSDVFAYVLDYPAVHSQQATLQLALMELKAQLDVLIVNLAQETGELPWPIHKVESVMVTYYDSSKP